jgi:superoxide dismutase, Cu-Zn family
MKRNRCRAAIASGIFASAVAGCLLMSGCAGSGSWSASAGVNGAGASVLLEPTKGNRATGSVRFTQQGGNVLVIVDVHNLAPGSVHGFHLHEKGDCSAPDAMSAGGHFNPDGQPHGPQTGPHHAGDMPALKADDNGVAKVAFIMHGVTVSAGPDSVLGKALIVHRDPDDYTTQPTGNSGARIACGVVVRR